MRDLCLIGNLSCYYFQTYNRNRHCNMSSDSTDATPDLSKEELNRIIVGLRSATEQAKVHTIHHLTKQIKALKSRKHSNDQQREQNERKAERFRQEIEILKKASKDSIGKWILVNKKSFNDILREESKTQNCDMEARVFARISDHSSTKSLIEKFRKTHEDWEIAVPKLLSTLGKKRKKNPTGAKSSIEPDDTETEHSEESDNNSEESEEDESDGGDGSEEIFVASLKAAIGGEKTLKEKKSEITKPVTTADRQTGEGVVKYLDLNAMDEVPKATQDKKYDISTSHSGKRSSFFVGGESDDECLGSDENADEVSDDDDPMVRNVHKRIDTFKKQHSASSRKESFPIKRKPHARETPSKKPRIEPNNDKRGKFQKKPVLTNESNKDSIKGSAMSSVHPSWEAKQKQKPSIQTFKGSKIVFDDSAPVAVGQTEPKKKCTPTDVSVHPSWEAKQMQKSSIQTFKGSKIVFDD